MSNNQNNFSIQYFIHRSIYYCFPQNLQFVLLFFVFLFLLNICTECANVCSLCKLCKCQLSWCADRQQALCCGTRYYVVIPDTRYHAADSTIPYNRDQRPDTTDEEGKKPFIACAFLDAHDTDANNNNNNRDNNSSSNKCKS